MPPTRSRVPAGGVVYLYRPFNKVRPTGSSSSSGLPIVAAIAAASSKVAAATAAASGLGLGLVHFQSTSVNLFAIERRDGRLGLFGSRHLNKRKAARTARFTVLDDIRRLDGARRSEHGL